MPDGGVLVGGNFPTFAGQAYRNLVRLGPTGAVDTGFSIGSGADSVVISLAVQPDGKYLVGGAFTTFNGVAHPGIVRLLPSGAVDTSFNAVIAGGYGEVHAIGIQGDGRIIIGGVFDSVDGLARKNFARLTPDGSVDLEFDPGTGADLGVRAIAVTAQDHVVLGGQFNTVNALPHGRIARYVADPTSGGPAANPHTIFAGGRDDWRRISLPRPMINTSGLDLLAEGTLFYMSTLGPPLFARLSYNSFPTTNSSGRFGNNWRFLYESSLTQYGSKQVVLQMGSGGRETFISTTSLAAATPGAPVTLTPMKGNFSQLKSYGTYFLYTEKDTRFVYRFDASSLGQPAYLTKIADRNGNALTINAALATGRIASIVDSAGRQLGLTYDANGRCSVMTTPNGRRIEFTYDASGALVQIKDMAGYLGKYTYTDGYLTRTDLGDLPSSDEGRVTNFAFTDKIWGTGKYVSSFVNVNGTTRIEPLDGSPNQSKWTTPNGVSTTVASEKGKTTSVQDPVGGISNLTYVEGVLTSYTNANGNAATYEYDARGNVTRATDALGHAISYTYDATDNLIQRHDAGANDWFYDYDSNSNLLKVHYPNLSQAVFGYDAQGRLVLYTDGRGKSTAYSYDAYGNLRTTTFPDGGLLTYTYSGNDQYTRCWSIVDTRGKQKSYGYDANNRITSVAYGPAPYDAQVGYAYDAQSLLAFTDELGNVTRAVRNNFDLITRLTDPLNWSTDFQYDSNNKLTQQTDALGRTVRTAYDAANRPIESTDAMGQVLKRYYDATGNLTSIRDPRLKTTRFAYDGNNRLKEIRNPLDHVIAKSYDANGRVTSIVNARGNTLSFAYDAMGNTTSKSFNAVQQVAYTYDAVGNMTAANHVSSGSVAYTYDDNGRVKTITWPDAKTATYAYDTEGNLTGLTYPDGLVVSSEYDNFSRRKLPSGLRHGPVDDLSPQRERANQATRIAWTGASIDFQYDKAANLVLETRSNGTNTSYTFNAKRKLTGIDHRKAATSFLNLGYSYDAVGRIVSAINSSTLAPPLQTSSSSAIYDDSNRLTSFGGTAWTSDADGNVAAAGTAFVATYDAESRPVSVTVNGVVIVYVYDGADRPYRVTRDGVVSYYHWDARGRLLFITDGAGTLLTRFVYRGSRLIAEQVQGGAWYFHHFDNIGNTLALTDASGNVVTSYAYLPSGKKAQSGASPSNPFTFVGERGVLEVADGLYLMGSRLYDAAAGRFLQRDPTRPGQRLEPVCLRRQQPGGPDRSRGDRKRRSGGAGRSGDSSEQNAAGTVELYNAIKDPRESPLENAAGAVCDAVKACWTLPARCWNSHPRFRAYRYPAEISRTRDASSGTKTTKAQLGRPRKGWSALYRSGASPPYSRSSWMKLRKSSALRRTAVACHGERTSRVVPSGGRHPSGNGEAVTRVVVRTLHLRSRFECLTDVDYRNGSKVRQE